MEKTAIVIPTTTITITGDTDDVQGGLILTAKNGEDTTFKINKKDGYTYTVKAGDTELTVGADGTVTRSVPVLGVPGCAMYNKATVLDLVLPRVAAGVPLAKADFVELGEGGLCLGCSPCTFPHCPFGR